MSDILHDIASGALPPSHILGFLTWRIREEISIWITAVKMLPYKSLEAYETAHPLLPAVIDQSSSMDKEHFIFINPQSW